MSEGTRTVHVTIAPVLLAYLAWADTEGRQYVAEEYDLFAAGYRMAKDEDASPVPTEATLS